jgi:branched-chain amino acid transport system permease protein
MPSRGRQREIAWIVAFGLLYAVASSLVTHSYYQLILTVVPVWALMGLSWNLLSGYSGFVSFGHAAFFGLGAYFVALTQLAWDLTPWISIPCAGLVGGLAALVVGIPTFRLRGHYFALAMLAYPLALLYVFEWLGYQELALPMRRDAAVLYMQFEDHRVYVWLAVVLMVVAMLLTLRVERSRFGMSLMAIKEDEAAAEGAGIRTLRCKLKAITLSGALAGIAGGFYAVVLLVVTPPAVFGMLVSAQALIVAMFGGAGTVWGPVIGALTLVPLSEILHAQLADRFPGIQGVVYGLSIIAVILIAPEGVVWRYREMRHGRTPEPLPQATPAPSALRADALPRGEVILDVHGVSKSFGGLHAVSDVSLQLKRGEILGIIGPNGAGKTTLFNLLNGYLRPDRGSIRIAGKEAAGLHPYDVCALGVGRTFQVARPFRRMSVLENVMVGAFVRTGSEAAARQVALGALGQVGLLDIAHQRAHELTNRQVRLLEIARAVAGEPRILLLDETLAGLGGTEVEEVIGVVRRLAGLGITVVIIEHTMEAMVRLAERFVVLDHGKVLKEGAPAEVTRDRAVIDAYLGKKWRATVDA